MASSVVLRKRLRETRLHDGHRDFNLREAIFCAKTAKSTKPDTSGENVKPIRWLNSHLKSSLMALLGSDEITPSIREDRTEDIRQLILEELGEFGESNFPKVTRRVRFAIDAQGLWYARGDVMAVLAAAHGETIAREKIDRISREFKGLVPSGLSARSSSLTS